MSAPNHDSIELGNDYGQYNTNYNAQNYPHDDKPRTSSVDMHHNNNNMATTTAPPAYPHDDNVPTQLQPPTLQHTRSDQPPPPVIEGNARNEMISQVVRGENSSYNKVKRVLQIIENLIEIALICVFIPLDWNKVCNRGTGLRVFLIARACSDFLMILTHLWSIKRPNNAKTPRTLLTLIEYGFVLFAMVELGEVDGCSGSPFWLSILLICLTFLPLILPFILLILVCCCLPCILRVLVRMIELQDAPEGATQEDIDTLPQFKWTPTLFAEQGVAEASECPICMLDYEQDAEMVVLPCHHGLHKECLVTWLKINKTCPLCRTDPFNGENTAVDQHRQEVAAAATTTTDDNNSNTPVDIHEQRLNQANAPEPLRNQYYVAMQEKKRNAAAEHKAEQINEP